jgi:branched-chain amino acid transport system substrate-binding protein
MGLGDLAGGKPINKGAISIAALKDPTDPKWAKDPGLAVSSRILKKYIPSANTKDGYYYAGMASAISLVDVLRRAGRNLTRASVMKAARSLNQPKHPLLIPGIVVKTSPTDGFPIEQMALQRWVTGKGSAQGHWSMFGPLRTARG